MEEVFLQSAAQTAPVPHLLRLCLHHRNPHRRLRPARYSPLRRVIQFSSISPYGGWLRTKVGASLSRQRFQPTEVGFVLFPGAVSTASR